jgi:hypothetical protein
MLLFLRVLSISLCIWLVAIIGIQFGHDIAEKAHYELTSINQQQASVEQPTKSEFNLPVDKRVP